MAPPLNVKTETVTVSVLQLRYLPNNRIDQEIKDLQNEADPLIQIDNLEALREVEKMITLTVEINVDSKFITRNRHNIITGVREFHMKT
jgi:hypothetical protein